MKVVQLEGLPWRSMWESERRPSVRPGGHNFVSSGRAEHDFVAEMRSAYLQSDGKARACPARRYGDRRLPGQFMM